MFPLDKWRFLKKLEDFSGHKKLEDFLKVSGIILHTRVMNPDFISNMIFFFSYLLRGLCKFQRKKKRYLSLLFYTSFKDNERVYSSYSFITTCNILL